jgi:hypothetical protein
MGESERTPHERSDARRRDPDDHVPWTKAPGAQKTHSFRFSILCPFDGVEDGAAASGDETHDAIPPGSERRRTFRRLQNSEASARSRSREEDPAAPGKRAG